MRGFLSIIGIVAAVSFGTVATADVLWDQSDVDEFGPGFFNSESGGPPFGLTQFAVNDVTVSVGDGGWTINTITIYYSALDPAWGFDILDGYVHVFDKVGPLPIDGSDDPTASPVVPMTGALVGTQWVVTATSLDIDLLPGDYWVGMTPIAASGPWGPEIHLSSMTLMADATASYDQFAMPGPPAWFNFNPGVDASILIEGEFGGPIAVEPSTWGQVKGLFNK